MVGSYTTDENNTRTYTFTRKLVTNDGWDLPLAIGEPYITMWAMGQQYKGKPIAHTMENRGREFLWLSEDYVDDGSDDDLGNGGYNGSTKIDTSELDSLAQSMFNG